jgi:hypothetical protein
MARRPPARSASSSTSAPKLDDYLAAVCRYLGELPEINHLPGIQRRSIKKERQLGLATLLGQAVAGDLRARGIRGAKAGEIPIAGALSRPRVDVVEATMEDGLKLGIEIKTVNEAAGRAMWNRVGDLRSFAVNYHLKFPYAVCGGVITVPDRMEGEPNLPRLIQRAALVLSRVNRRPDEGAAPHRLEAIAFIVYHCDEHGAALHTDIPAPATGLRYEQFIDALIAAYEGRFFPRFEPPELVEDSGSTGDEGAEQVGQ